MSRLFNNIKSGIWEIIESLTFSLAIFSVVYLFLFMPMEVHGASSEPTLQEGDRFIIDKISYRFDTPSRGDFVVIQSPQNPDVDFIKRIIGLPGEIISLQAGSVFINRNQLIEAYLPARVVTTPGSCLPEGKNLLIPAGYYFVMGDNRSHSSDSRSFCSIEGSKIIGRAVFRWWPPGRVGQP